MILLYCRNCFPPVRSLIGYFEVKWHRTMKLFLAEISERATVQNLWRQRVTAHCYRGMLTDDRLYSEVMNFQLTLRFSGYKINCFPRDPSLSVWLIILSIFYSFFTPGAFRYSHGRFHRSCDSPQYRQLCTAGLGPERYKGLNSIQLCFNPD